MLLPLYDVSRSPQLPLEYVYNFSVYAPLGVEFSVAMSYVFSILFYNKIISIFSNIKIRSKLLFAATHLS